MNSGPLIPFLLPSNAYAASGTFQVSLDSLPKRINNGLISHVAKFNFILPLTPTYSSGVGTINGDNAAVNQSLIFDGITQRFQGGFRELRACERMQLGKPAYPDETYVASASERVVRREFSFGPRNFKGAPTDFIVPAAMFQGSTIQGQFGALTDIDANVTAASGTLRVIAWLYGLDSEMRIPPVYEVRNYAAQGGNLTLPGTFAYDFISAYKSTWAAWAAGEVGNVTMDFGTGPLIQAINATDLAQEFNSQKSVDLAATTGQPSSATDISLRRTNPTTPTALTDADNSVQPIWWSTPDCKLSKLTVSTGTALLQTTGSVTAYQVQVGRFIPQNAQSLAVYAQRALTQMPDMNAVSQGIKTLKGKQYMGNMQPFMPMTIKLKRK